ncbi:MAG: hypothetical protein HYY65_12310 [Candidatus Tectomicrobia bacterium]|uniref:Alginate export domain-containing protein n=1 Tax=Tectimicrobiota bacterium TaxID=2528274 RepID=A0A932GRI9_UNCTE|nr:hypothetical protein [Candidatus Tectomicrobia bacterium]
MRRAAVFMLAVALVVGFTLPALAADVKFTGDFYVRGYSVNNSAVVENTLTGEGGGSLRNLTGRSLAGADSWFDERLRVNMVATVSDKLSIISRFDIDEGEWGTPGGTPTGDRDGFANGFSVQRAFLRYTPSKQLMFDVGHNGWEWDGGYSFAKNRKTQPDGITAYWNVGPGRLILAYSKLNDCSDAGANRSSGCGGANRTFVTTVTTGSNVTAGQENDADRDYSTVAYSFKVGAASLQPSISYDRNTLDQDVSVSRVMPRLFGSAKVGAFNIKFEGAYDWGKASCGQLPGVGNTTTTFSSFQHQVARCITSPQVPEREVDIRSWVGYVEAGYAFGFGELGLQYVYASGDGDPNDERAAAWASAGAVGATNDQGIAASVRHQDETGLLWYRNGGYGSNSTNQGNNGIGTVAGARSGRGFTNAQVYGGYGKFKVAGGDLLANIFYAKANEVVMNNGTLIAGDSASTNQSKTYGTEVSATYFYPLLKELVLSASGGYLWAGDYFKGGASGIELKDPWVLQWALTARF